MTIYDSSVRQLMREYAAELTTAQIVNRRDVLAWFAARYPRIKKSTVNAHIVKMSTNAPSRVHYSVRRDGDDDLFLQVDSSHLRRYDPNIDPAPIYSEEEAANARAQRPIATGPDEDDQDPITSPGASTFAYEHDLRDYLARNLVILEPGLRLYREAESGITGVEYPVGGRFIDILAVDGDGRLVVAELKVSRGYDRVVGQLLRYMGWIRTNLAEAGQEVRGMIIANQISEDLRLACSEIPGVSLYEYDLAVTVRRADRATNGAFV